MTRKPLVALFVLTAMLFGMFGGAAQADDKVSIEVYYPVVVSGSIASLIEGLMDEFMEQNPDIDVNYVFAGSYNDSMTKLALALEAGTEPQLIILENDKLYSMIALDAALCLDDLVATDGGDEYLNGFYDVYMETCVYDGSVYAIPFQRSVLTMYYNKEHFEEVGLDPDHAPATWDEMAEFGAKLTKRDDNGNVTGWGVRVGTGGWATQSLAISASNDGSLFFSDDGTQVDFAGQAVTRAFEYLLRLAEAGASPEGIVSEGANANDFIEGAASIVFISSGNLANINNSVDFEYGIGALPSYDGSYKGASIGSGGNLFVVKSDKTTQAQYDATWKLVRFLTDPEIQARWAVDTGYIASTISSLETETMKAYFSDVPQAQAIYDQLSATYKQMTTYDSARVASIFTNAAQYVVTGEKTVETALAEAQAEADLVLSDYR